MTVSKTPREPVPGGGKPVLTVVLVRMWLVHILVQGFQGCLPSKCFMIKHEDKTKTIPNLYV